MSSYRKLQNWPKLLFCTLLAVYLTGVLSGCRSQPDYDRAEELREIPLHTFPVTEESREESIFQTYRIASGDVLDCLYHARTWRKQERFELAVGNVVAVKFVDLPKLNQEQRVRPDGAISLPYLGEVDVLGKTVQELRRELMNKYADILKSPELYVVVPQFRNAIKELKRDLHTAPRGLSRLTTVRPDGYATFPMLGDIQVRGRTMPEVSKELNGKYEEILPGMAVDLFLREHAGRRIYVLGAVDKPGAHEISRPTTVAEALALSGSHLPSANIQQVAVMRRRGDKVVGRFLDLKDALTLDKDSEFFFLQPDDIVYVPRRRLNRLATVAREVSEVLFFRGWSVGFSYELHDEESDNNE